MINNTKLFRDLNESERAYFLRLRRQRIAEAKRKGATRIQDSYHGAGHYSLQAFAADGSLVMDRGSRY